MTRTLSLSPAAERENTARATRWLERHMASHTRSYSLTKARRKRK